MYMSPYLYVETYEAYGKTTLNGTYNIYYAEYWKNENEEDVVGALKEMYGGDADGGQ